MCVCANTNIKADIYSLCNTWRVTSMHDRNGTCKMHPKGVGADDYAQSRPLPGPCWGFAGDALPCPGRPAAPWHAALPGTLPPSHIRCQPGALLHLGALPRLVQVHFICCIWGKPCGIRTLQGQGGEAGKHCAADLSVRPHGLGPGRRLTNRSCGLRFPELLIIAWWL